jgi:hypothetical protein
MTQLVSTGPMNVGDFLVHEQEDGLFALHSYESWRDGAPPPRAPINGDKAARDLARESASASGGTAWLNHWKAPGEFSEA